MVRFLLPRDESLHVVSCPKIPAPCREPTKQRTYKVEEFKPKLFVPDATKQNQQCILSFTASLLKKYGIKYLSTKQFTQLPQQILRKQLSPSRKTFSSLHPEYQDASSRGSVGPSGQLAIPSSLKIEPNASRGCNKSLKFSKRVELCPKSQGDKESSPTLTKHRKRTTGPESRCDL